MDADAILSAGLAYPASCFKISFPSFCVSPKNF
jgi:hypothetical protein